MCLCLCTKSVGLDTSGSVLLNSRRCFFTCKNLCTFWHTFLLLKKLSSSSQNFFSIFFASLCCFALGKMFFCTLNGCAHLHLHKQLKNLIFYLVCEPTTSDFEIDFSKNLSWNPLFFSMDIGTRGTVLQC